MVLKITGIVPPHITPFSKNEEIDKPALRRLICFWLDSGCSGLAACASNGEGPYLTREEKKKVIGIVTDEVNGRVPVIAGTGAPSTVETIGLTRDAKDAGADAALIVAPYYYRPNDKELYEHYKAVLDATDFPTIIYNVPKFTGYDLNISMIVRLVEEYNQVIGVKDSSASIERLSKLALQVGKRISVLAGTGDVILPALIMGAAGAIVAVANFAPKLCVKIYQSFKEENIEVARESQAKVLILNEVIVKKFSQISSVKEAMNQLGQPAGYPRRPSLPLEPAIREEISKTLSTYL